MITRSIRGILKINLLPEKESVIVFLVCFALFGTHGRYHIKQSWYGPRESGGDLKHVDEHYLNRCT